MAFTEAGVIFTAKGVTTFLRTFNNINRTLDDFNTKIGKAATSANRLEDQLNNITNSVLIGFIAAVTAAAIAVGSISLAGIETAASFEDAFADVTKTVDAFIDRAATAESGLITLTEQGQEFRDAIKELSFEIPVAFEELSRIAGLGGQLGIVEGLAGDEAKEALLSFTETVAGLGEATNLTQEKAATGLAQISNIFRQTVDDIGSNIERLGATIVGLGNTSAATESLILNFSQRIAGAGQTVGLTQAEVLGIGTAFASIGITAEAGSTAVNRALLIINEAVSNSTDKFLDNTAAIKLVQDQMLDLNADLVRLESQTGITGESLTEQRDSWIEAGNAVEDFGRQLGDTRREQLFQTQTAIDSLEQKLRSLRTTQGQALTTEVFDELLRVVQSTQRGAEQTAETFRELFRDDPAEAFALFVEGLSEEGERAGETLDKIGLGSVEATRAFLAMSGAVDLVRDRIDAANDFFGENSALVDEVSVRYATLTSNFQEFINVVRGVTESIFSPLIGPLNSILEFGKEIVQVVGEEIPRVLEALASKFGPIFEGLVNQIFGSGGLFAGGEITTPEGFNLSGEAIGAKLFEDLFPGGEITTPEGFVLSGDLIGIEPKDVRNIRDAFQSLIDTINSVDVSKWHQAALFWRDTVVPIWVEATSWATENTDFLRGAVQGLTTVIGGTVLAAAITKAASILGILATPLGQVSLLVIGLSIAWETNFLNIQEVTDNVITGIKSSLEDFKKEIEELDLGSLFDSLFSGEQMTTPEGFTISGEAIGITEETNTLITNFGIAAGFATEKVGELFNTFTQSVLDRLSGILSIFTGLRDVFRNITEDAGTLEGILRGLLTVSGGFLELATAPIFNIAEFFGIDLSSIKDFGFNTANSFIEGFIEGFTGVQVSDFGETVQGLLSAFQTGDFTLLAEGLENIRLAFSGLVAALVVFKDVVKEFVGLTPDESLIKFLGQIAGFLVGLSIEQLTNVVEGLTGLVIALDGLFSLDYEKGVSGMEIFGKALGESMLQPLISLDKFFEGGISSRLLDAIKNLQLLADQVGEIWGLILENWEEANQEIPVTDATGVLFNPRPNLVEVWTNVFEGIDVGIPSTDQLSQWLVTVLDQVRNSIANVWNDVDLGLPSARSLTEFIFTIPQQIKDSISGIWNDVDLGLPSFESLLTKAQEIADKVKGFFTGIFDVDFDFGILDKLAELGIIDLGEIETPDTSGIGEDISQGLITEIEEAEESWKDTFLNFLLNPIETGKEALGIQSPSTVTQEIGQSLVEGLALGLSDLTPVTEAITPLFDALKTRLETLHVDSIPKTTEALVDGLIPAKIELAEVNLNELIPSVDALIEVEEMLRDTLDSVRSSLERLIDKHRDAKSKIRDQIKEVDKLREAYEKLADAINNIDSVSPPAPNTGPVGPEFQSGGTFIVPSNIGPEGLPIRVHANELVQIIPAEFRRKVQSVPMNVVPSTVRSPQIGGMVINETTNDSSTTNDVKELHLHVQEIPSTDLRVSFGLLEALI